MLQDLLRRWPAMRTGRVSDTISNKTPTVADTLRVVLVQQTIAVLQCLTPEQRALYTRRAFPPRERTGPVRPRVSMWTRLVSELRPRVDPAVLLDASRSETPR